MTEWHAGDTKPDLEDTTGTDLNAAGTTVTVHVRTPSRTLISRAAVVATGTTGAWSLPWQAGELNTPGRYESEVQVELPDGSVQTFDGPSFQVKPQLDSSGPTFTPPNITILDGGAP